MSLSTTYLHRWDIQRFIKEIKQRKSLWDPKNYNYMNKKFTQHEWQTIADMFNLKGILARQKWKNLRDTFRAELKKIDAGKPASSWVHYDEMLFLKPLIKTKKSDTQESIYDDSSMDNIYNDIKDNIKIEDDITFSSVDLNCPIEDDYLKNTNDVIDFCDRNPIETERLNERSVDEDKTSNDDEDDETLLFFRSLLPFVKKLPENKILLFRMDVQQALYKQLYETNH